MSRSTTKMPTRISIHGDHVHNPDETTGVNFRPDEEYFVVRVNEMYLTDKRKWVKTFDPLVFVITEFTYDKVEQTLPFVVGPTMLEKYQKKLPLGMIFSDTRVAGPYPRHHLKTLICNITNLIGGFVS
jgi:hypothetical protein